LKKLHENFGSDISLDQLQDWIEEEIISKASKYRKKEHPNSSYVKLPQTDLDVLEKIFEKDNYPSYEEMQRIADAFGVSLSKIENWYKHQRRSLAKKGELIIPV
jgi:NADH:ubiquinone oxidoreductase subunit E